MRGLGPVVAVGQRSEREFVPPYRLNRARLNLTRRDSTGRVASILRRDSLSGGVGIDLVAPTRPTGDALAGEEFQIRPGAALLDQLVLLVGLARVFALLPGDDVHLPPSGSQRPQLAPHAEQQQLRHIAEIKPDSAAIGAAVLADLEPDQ